MPVSLCETILWFVLQEMLEMCSSHLIPKSVETIPGLTTPIEHQIWLSIQVVNRLPEGSGVFATSTIISGSMVCNYGGSVAEQRMGQHNSRGTQELFDASDCLLWRTNLVPVSQHGLRVCIWKIHLSLQQTAQFEA